MNRLTALPLWVKVLIACVALVLSPIWVPIALLGILACVVYGKPVGEIIEAVRQSKRDLEN